MVCDFCEQPAALAVETVDGSATAYLCDQHVSAVNSQISALSDWFEPAAIGSELDPRSGLPVIQSRD